MAKWFTKEKKDNIVPNEQFIIPRNDPFDPYKPNSDVAVGILSTAPITQKLIPDDYAMLRKVAADMDRSLPTDEIEGFPARLVMSEESRAELARLPTWLKSMLESRWELIQSHFGHGVHKFIRLIANGIETQYRTVHSKLIGETLETQNQLEADEVYEGFQILEDESCDATKTSCALKNAHEVALAVEKFKAMQNSKKFWEPVMVIRAESCLRTAMATKAALADLAMLAEDIGIHDAYEKKRYIDENDSDEEVDEKLKKSRVTEEKWAVVDRDALYEEAKATVNAMYHLKSTGPLSKTEKKQVQLKKKAMQVAKRKKKVPCWSYCKMHPLFAAFKLRKERKKQLLERALYRRYSRIWYKGCGDELGHSEKLTSSFRVDEGIHSYVVSLVTCVPFKFFIMFVIVSNAILLAIETGDQYEYYGTIFLVLDNFFLSVYLMEFILKIYAHPYKYWKSGYNVFDFVILLVSLLKTLIEWLDIADVDYLSVLLIVRAMRVLRGVSLSSSLQILVTALVETIRTHVLSVVILLLLLMYIAAIIAYYMYGQTPGLRETWGTVQFGMLRMFTFVTMDGWTDITHDFETHGYFITGRIFSLCCIVLGNFLFSNIFIAIIIMNISEATDGHREQQRNEKDELTSIKKSIVFNRQKLDMRQLLARQKMSVSDDFFYVGGQFQRLLRHDDLVAMQEVCTSPLWIDCLYKTFIRCHNTANILLNTHRNQADTLLECYNFYGASRYNVDPIRRGRYNRYMKLKAKLALIKTEIYRHRNPKEKLPLKIRYMNKVASALKNNVAASATAATLQNKPAVSTATLKKKNQ